jgi:hypothetical protein
MAEDNQTSGPTGVKDLGGLVNKDIAFSKVPENVVFDSKNFRITTDDGGTLAVRSTIKGNEEITIIPQYVQTTCINNGKIKFNLRGAVEYFFLETLSTLRTTIAITNSAGVTTNVSFDYLNDADNFVIPGSGFYIGVNFELLQPAKYIFSLLNFLNSNSVAQQSNIVIDTINYSNYDDQTLGAGPNILEFSFTSNCNVTINFTSLINLTATNSNGKSYLGYFNDPYLENFVLRDASNGLSGLDPLSNVYPSTQATGILTNYNQIFDITYSAYTPPFLELGSEFKNVPTIISEYNQTGIDWDPSQAPSNDSTIPYFLPVEKTNAIVDSTTNTTIETSAIRSYLKIQDKFDKKPAVPEYLRNTAITNLQKDYGVYGLYNPANYGGTWNFNLSYYIGKMSSNISLKVKVYIHLHSQANGAKNPALVNLTGVTTTGSTALVNQFPTVANPTYVPPNTFIGPYYSDFNQPLFGGNNVTAAPYITDLHTLVYEETFTTGSQNKLEAANNSVKFNITFPNNLSALGANVTPSISVFLEPVYLTTAAPQDWNYEFYLDKLDVRGTPLNTGQALTGLNVINNNVTTTSVVGTPYPQDLLIGWCTLRDDVYLFFTDGKEDPDDPTTWSNPSAYTPSTKNEIWKFTYNKAGNLKDTTQYPSIFNFQLVYSNPDLNFTIHRPIANPGMIESRYENDAVQKIYWTDNFNVPRQINVGDPNVASFTIDQLNLQPILTMDIPFITQVVDNGDLLIGVYQVLYRLKSTNGAETRFGPASQLIPIIDYPESTSDIQYYFPADAVGAKANKSIAVQVYNVDTDYDTIEFVLVYYDNDNTPKTIDIIKEEFIPETGFVSTIITGGEYPIPITIDELTAFTTSIKRCKTLAAKKQTLFLGNLVTGSSIVDWDARAYRFPRVSSQTRIKDDLGNSYLLDYNSGAYTLSGMVDPANNTTTYANPIPVDAKADCIQDYDMQAPLNDSKYLYKPNSSVLGGAGPNVSYEFITASVELSALENKTTGVGTNEYGVPGPYVDYIGNDQGFHYGPSTSPTFYFNGRGTVNNQSPYHYDMLVGYRRDEMYRFGIVFFDELDNPTYVNWIADIRMPHVYMPDTSQGSSILNNSVPNILGTGNKRTRIGVTPDERYINDHQLPSFGTQFTSDVVTYPPGVDTSGKYNPIGKPLGIRFTIDFSKVPSQYKRAAIVRVPRKDEDKHILGQGIACPTYKQTGTPAASHIFTCTPFKYNAYDPANPTSGKFNEIWHSSWTLNSPEFLFNGYPGFAGNDAVDFVSLLASTSSAGLAASSYTRAANYSNNSTWPMREQYVANDNYFTGIVSRLYKTIEGPLVPSAIKQYTYTSNPYPLETAFSLKHAAGFGGELNEPYFESGIISIPGSLPRRIHNCSPRDTSASSGGGIEGSGATGHYSYGGKSLFLQLKDGPAYDWNYTVSYGGKNFLGLDSWGISSGGSYFYELQYLANYKRTPASQYGGNSYFQRAINEYIPCNNLIDISNKSNPITFNLFGGDTRVTIMGNARQFFDFKEAQTFDKNDRVDLLHKIHLFAVETSIAVDYRRNRSGATPTNDRLSKYEYICIPHRYYAMEIFNDINWCGVGNSNYWVNVGRMSNYEYFQVDKVFNHTDKSLYTYFPMPALGIIPNKYDCRIWKSEIKIDGEVSDSWAVYKPAAYKDVESAYGPINNLIIFRDKMYYFQDKGFGIAQVDEQKLVQAGNATISDLVLGSSGILERYDYISTKTGTKHQFSMSVSDYSIIWFDSLARKMYRYKGEGLEPLSDIKGLNAYLYNRTAGNLQISDNPYIFKGIHSTYDFRHNEFYTTFVDESDNSPVHITLVYNDLLDGFIGEYTHYPKVYINDKVNIFSPRPTMVGPELFFIHNYGQYGRFYNRTPDFAELSFVLNTSSIIEKVLHNLEFVSEAYAINTIVDPTDSYLYDPLAEVKYQDFFDSMRIFDNYQNTDWINLIPNRLDLSSRDNYARKHKTIWDVRVPSDRVLNVNQNIFDPLNLSPVRPRLTKRLKDKWFMVQLVYNNANNNKLVVHSVKPTYALNSR